MEYQVDRAATNHPFIQVLVYYYQSYDALREKYQSLSNRLFQTEYGFHLHAPNDWPYMNAVHAVCNIAKGDVLIIYSNANSYREYYEILGDRASYMSWQEIYTDMHRSSLDARDIQRKKGIISESEVTFFLDASGVDPDILGFVKNCADNCLITLG